jgi:hypothetical protein
MGSFISRKQRRFWINVNIKKYILSMSFQNQGVENLTVERLVPNYVIKSDYLPTRVVDGNSAQTAQLVNAM